jgi:hypothetical protein
MAAVFWKKVRGVWRSSFVYLALFVFGLSFVYPMLPVSLDYHFLIALNIRRYQKQQLEYVAIEIYNIVLLRDAFHIGLVIGPRPAVLAKVISVIEFMMCFTLL